VKKKPKKKKAVKTRKEKTGTHRKEEILPSRKRGKGDTNPELRAFGEETGPLGWREKNIKGLRKGMV